jgi:hypothetical protein
VSTRAPDGPAFEDTGSLAMSLSAIENHGCLLGASFDGFATTTELVRIGGLLRVTQRCRDPVAGSLTSIKER